MTAERKTLVLRIEVPDFNAEYVEQFATEFLGEGEPVAASDYLAAVTEMLRTDVGLTLVSLPGEQEGSDEFTVKAFNGVIVGAEVKDR